jgi:hypothetical protein
MTEARDADGNTYTPLSRYCRMYSIHSYGKMYRSDFLSRLLFILASTGVAVVFAYAAILSAPFAFFIRAC